MTRHRQPVPADRKAPRPRGAFLVCAPGVGAPAAPGEGGAGGRTLPPAYWPHGSPGRSWCRQGSDARRSSANVRLPAAAQVEAVQPFALDRLPGTPPAGHWRWPGVGRAFGACCFAGKLRSPARPLGDGLTRPSFGASTPTRVSTRVPTRVPTPAGGVPLGSVVEGIGPAQCPFGGPVGRKNRGRLAPLGGVERPRRAVRFARLIHRRGRALGRTFGPRRLRQQSQACPGCYPEWCLAQPDPRCPPRGPYGTSVRAAAVYGRT